MEIGVRPAMDTDMNLLIGFMREFYAIDAYPFDEQVARGALGDLLADPALGQVWLICRDTVAVGYVVLTFGYSLEYHGRNAWVDELFVQAEQRGQGAGTAAMRFIIDAAGRLGAHTLHLEVEQHNQVAQGVYRRLGFSDQGRRLLTLWLGR